MSESFHQQTSQMQSEWIWLTSWEANSDCDIGQINWRERFEHWSHEGQRACRNVSSVMKPSDSLTEGKQMFGQAQAGVAFSAGHFFSLQCVINRIWFLSHTHCCSLPAALFHTSSRTSLSKPYHRGYIRSPVIRLNLFISLNLERHLKYYTAADKICLFVFFPNVMVILSPHIIGGAERSFISELSKATSFNRQRARHNLLRFHLLIM